MQAYPGHNTLVALVSNSTWSVYNFRADIIRLLLEDGFQVLVIAPEDDYADKLRNMGCQLHSIDFNNRTLNPFSDILLYHTLRKLYEQYKPAYIFHYVAKPNIYGTLAAHKAGIPSVAIITGLGYAFSKKNLLYRMMSKLYRFSLSKASEVWFLNKEDANSFIMEDIVDIKKVKVMPGEGVNTEHFCPGQKAEGKKRFRFVMSTRLLKSKGVALYADAARILRRKNYDADFYLIGFFENHHPDTISIPDLHNWQTEGLLQYKGFAGDVREYLENADCFVFPSFYNEGVPRCLMEASSMELPIVTSYNRGCKDVVLHNKTGFLCQRNNAFDLAEKMEQMMLMEDDERIRMGRYGRKLMKEKFSIESIYHEYRTTLQGSNGD